MGLTKSDISAVIVTRGDVDLEVILNTLPYDEVVIWDNSKEEDNLKCYGRYVGAEQRSTKGIIYFQDDDIIFREHEALMKEYVPGHITTNMPAPWYYDNSYDKLKQALVGAGSLCPRWLWAPAFSRYLEHYEKDDLFLNYCDFVFGQLTLHKRIDLGYQILPHASGPNRIYTQPGAHDRKMTVINRAIGLRIE